MSVIEYSNGFEFEAEGGGVHAYAADAFPLVLVVDAAFVGVDFDAVAVVGDVASCLVVVGRLGFGVGRMLRV
jgi:hypothetical protein